MLQLLRNPLQFEQIPEADSCLLVSACQLSERSIYSTAQTEFNSLLASCFLWAVWVGAFSLCDIRATEWSILIYSDQLSLSCETAARSLNEDISQGSPWDRYQVTKLDQVQTLWMDLLQHLPWKFRYLSTFWDLWVECHGEVQIAVRFDVSLPGMRSLSKMILLPTKCIRMIARGATVRYQWKSYPSISINSIKFNGE